MDFVQSASRMDTARFALFSRNPEPVSRFLKASGLESRHCATPLAAFGREEYSAIINFIGVGDPARAQKIAPEILSITSKWDNRVLDYLKDNRGTRYIFLSSGAVYGTQFDKPANESTLCAFPVNSLGAENFYGIAKLHAEAAHRAHPGLSIVDIRVFNYVSKQLDLGTRFLISDLINALVQKRTFVTNRSEIVRDFLHQDDLYSLIAACLAAPPGTNTAVDAFSSAPIRKSELLDFLGSEFGLRYSVDSEPDIVNATGQKQFYFSENRAAARFGYTPRHSSRTGLKDVIGAILQAHHAGTK